MDLVRLKRNWDALGREDPMWAVLSGPGHRGNKWDPEAFFRTGREYVTNLLAGLRQQGVAMGTGRALDFGCGLGRLSQALGDTFDQVDGIDIAPSMVEGAREHNRHGERVAYHVNDRSDLSLFPDGTFDFVLSVIVLQHMENRYKAAYLREFVRVSKPGGVIVFTVPSHAAFGLRGLAVTVLPNSLLNWYRRKRYGYTGVMELHPMRRRKVEEVVAAAGASVVDVREEPLAGPPWRSYCYVVTKPPTA